MTATTSLPTWRATPADPSDYFAEDELARARRYQRPLRVARVARTTLVLAVLALVVLGGVATSLVDALDDRGWIVQLVAVLVLLELATMVVDVPFDVWVDFVHDRRWGLSTQTASTFVADQVKSLLVSTVLSVLLLVPLYALIRATEWWWLVGWLLVAALGVLVGFLFPVVVAPLFNRFEPLRDPELVARVQRVADASGVRISDVLVADQSRRSRRDNAYVAGFGTTRRVVLFDTLLDHPPELIEQVVAHELGHWRRHHLRQQIPLLVATTFVAFVALRLLAGWDALWSWFGLDGLADPASLPLLLLGAQLASAVTGVVTAFVSRAHERQADLDALDVLRRPADTREMLRRLHVKNIADLDPGPLQRMRMSHPPPAERMAFVDLWCKHREGTGDVFTSA